MAFHPGGQLLASAGVDVQPARVPDRNRPRTVGPALVPKSDHPRQPAQPGEPLTGPTGSIVGLAISPDSRLLAAASEDGHAHLWDIADHQHPIPLAALGVEPASMVGSVAFSPDGQTLAASTSAGEVAFWDLKDPRHPAMIGRPLAAAPDIIYATAFTSDGRIFATGSFDGVVRLWDFTNRDQPTRIGGEITGLDGHIQTLAFSPDNKILAGGNRGQIHLWNVADPRRTHSLASLDRSRQTTWSLAFSPDGQILAAANGDVRLWDIDPERVATQICATAGDPLTEAEWRKHAPDVAFQPACR